MTQDNLKGLHQVFFAPLRPCLPTGRFARSILIRNGNKTNAVTGSECFFI